MLRNLAKRRLPAIPPIQCWKIRLEIALPRVSKIKAGIVKINWVLWKSSAAARGNSKESIFL